MTHVQPDMEQMRTAFRRTGYARGLVLGASCAISAEFISWKQNSFAKPMFFYKNSLFLAELPAAALTQARGQSHGRPVFPNIGT
jgi:hypothetical protein